MAASTPALGQIPVERRHPLGEVAKRIDNILKEIGLTTELQALGSEPFSAWRCVLTDSDGQPAPDGEGLGKGESPDACRVGALCEALEHLASGRALSRPDEIVLSTQGDVADSLSDEGFRTVLTERGLPIGCLPFHPLGGEGAVLVPAGVTCPWYVESAATNFRVGLGDRASYESIWRYSSNSGVALGLGWEEAVLHGLHEAVERDAYSLFLLDACVRQRDVGRLRVDLATLDDRLSQLVATAQQTVGASIHLFDITTDIGIPAAFAMAKPPGRQIPFRGSGASLFRGHAIARAVTELVQDRDYDRWSAEQPAASSGPPRPSFDPAIQRSQRLEFSCLDAALAPAESAVADKLSVGAQLAEATGRLNQAGFSPLVRKVAGFSRDVQVVQVFVPGLERFMLVTAGHPLAPGKRGSTCSLLAMRATSRGSPAAAAF